MERRPKVILLPADAAKVDPPSKKAPGAAAAGKSPRPVLPANLPASLSVHPFLITMLATSAAAMLILPTVAAIMLAMGRAAANSAEEPINLSLRTMAFLMTAFGLWGLAIFIAGSCRYSVTRGRSWAWGLLGLPALSSFVVLSIYDNPIWGSLAFLGVGGILVPYSLAEDRLAAVSHARRSPFAWATTVLAGLGIFAGATLAYGNSFAGGMTLDNKYIIEEYYNTLRRMDPGLDFVSPRMIGYIFQNDYWWPKGISGLYRPLVTLSYWINYVYQHNQLNTFQYHVVNFVLHWFAAFLAFLLMRTLVGRPWIAFFTALLFVTHPMGTESVSNIIGRADIAAAIAVFAGLLLYIESTKREGFWKTPWLFALMLVTAIGLFSKESAISLVGVIIAYDIVYRWTLDDLREAVPSLTGLCAVAAIAAGIGIGIGEFGALGLSEGLLPVLRIFLVISLIAAGLLIAAWISWKGVRQLTVEQALTPWWKYFLPYAAMLPPIIGWFAARRWVFANSTPPETPFLDNPIRGLGFFAARMTASDVFLRLLGLLAFPKTLSADYSFNQIPLFNGHLGEGDTWIAIAGVLTLLGILGLVIVTFRRHRAVCFLILFYLLAYLPTSNFLLIIGSIMAERFTYLPLLGFVGCVVLGIDALARRFWTDTGKVEHVADGRRSDQTSSTVPSIAAYSLLAIIACTYGLRSWFRNRDWFSDVTLWTAAAEASPMSFRSYQSKAFALFEQYNLRQASGVYAHDTALRDHDIDQTYQTAEHAKPIVDVLPLAQNSSRLYLHLGMYYFNKGDTLCEHHPDGSATTTADALPWFRASEKVLQQAIQIDRTFNGINRDKELKRKIKQPEQIPDVGLPPIYFFLGNTYAHLGEWDKALQAFQYMNHLDPADPESYVRLASVYMQRGKMEETSIALIQAMVINPSLTNLWPAVDQALAQINHSGSPALTIGPNRQVQIHTELPLVRSVLCSAYQGLVRNFLLARRFSNAKDFANMAIAPKEKGGWEFPAPLFDEMFRSVNSDAEMPVPPPAD